MTLRVSISLSSSVPMFVSSWFPAMVAETMRSLPMMCWNLSFPKIMVNMRDGSTPSADMEVLSPLKPFSPTRSYWARSFSSLRTWYDERSDYVCKG